MSNTHTHSPQDEEMLTLHDEVMEKYIATLKKWEPELPAKEMPALISTYDVIRPEKVSGYKALITTVLIDEVNEERIAGLLNLVNKTLRG